MAEKASAWADLLPRILSAVAMVALVALALWAGPLVWGLFVLLISFVMFWELARLCEPEISGLRRITLALSPVLLAGALNVTFQGGLGLPMPEAIGTGRATLGLAVGLGLPLLAGLTTLRSGRLIWAGYGLMVQIGALYLVYAYAAFGITGVVALIIVIALSDILGYFAGRLLGGPKFWPRVSPKKTWSGTVAGWIGAGLFGFFALGAPLLGAVTGVGLALAGQMGDIAESAMKRRVGVKDSSNLIPGHGGVLDRLDALVAAAALAGIVTFVYSVWIA